MIINHNMSSMNAHRQMIGNTANSGKSMEKLSSGLRINRAGDDAAGLAISEKMRGQIRGLDQATRNSQDGISLIQTAEGALNETHSILQRMRELAVQASNDTNNTSDRGQIQKEINQLTSEINRIGNTTEFNTMKLLNGDKSATKDTGTVKVSVASQSINVASSLGVTSQAGAIDLGTAAVTVSSATSDINWTKIDTASTTQVVFKKDGNGKLAVTIQGTDSAGTTINITDTVDPTQTTGAITYNNHGVSFSVTQAAFAAATVSATTTIDLITAADLTAVGTVAGSYQTSNDFSANTGNLTMTSGITLTGASVDQGLRYVRITGSTGGQLQVELLADTAGTTLDTDVISGAFTTAATSFTYNDHGISFTIDVGTALNTFTTNALEVKTNSTAVTKDNSLAFQVGANTAQSMTVSIDDMRSNALKITSTTAGGQFSADKAVTDGTNNTSQEYALDVTTASNATKNITKIQDAMDKVSDARAALGAYQNRLEHTIANLGTSSENLQAAESRIRDVDMAKEMSTFSKNNILAQAAQAMLAQANQQPQQVLQLLR